MSSCRTTKLPNVNCKKLFLSFLDDSTIKPLIGLRLKAHDTIFIVDISKTLHCHSFTLNDHLVVFSTNTTGLSMDSRKSHDLKAWRNHIAIRNIEIRNQYYKLYFYYKPTNAGGFVTFNFRNGEMIPISTMLEYINMVR